ncbi:hypothetical protein BC941DRAFT_74207 [Chlamydoabsidia padenii]|nr:hypothetical protein BC941DRAFT_74207 [Chlamydoabsidia padenii]
MLFIKVILYIKVHFGILHIQYHLMTLTYPSINSLWIHSQFTSALPFTRSLFFSPLLFPLALVTISHT